MKKTTKKLALLRETLGTLENAAGGGKPMPVSAAVCEYTYSCPEWSCTCTR